MLWSISLVSRGQQRLACPQPTRWGRSVGRVGKREAALVLCKPCSAIAKTSACFQQCLSHRPKTLHSTAAVKKVNLIPGQILYTWKKTSWNRRFLSLKFHSHDYGNPSQLWHLSSMNYLHPQIISHYLKEEKAVLKTLNKWRKNKSWQQLVYNYRVK